MKMKEMKVWQIFDRINFKRFWMFSSRMLKHFLWKLRNSKILCTWVCHTTLQLNILFSWLKWEKNSKKFLHILNTDEDCWANWRARLSLRVLFDNQKCQQCCFLTVLNQKITGSIFTHVECNVCNNFGYLLLIVFSYATKKFLTSGTKSVIKNSIKSSPLIEGDRLLISSHTYFHIAYSHRFWLWNFSKKKVFCSRLTEKK